MPTGQENLDLRVYVDYPQERQNRKGPYVFATDIILAPYNTPISK